MAHRSRLRADALEWRQIDDEIVLLDARESTYLTTNGSGTILWHALAEGATRDELVDRLVAAYGIDREQAAADTDGFVQALRARGLLDEHRE